MERKVKEILFIYLFIGNIIAKSNLIWEENSGQLGQLAGIYKSPCSAR